VENKDAHKFMGHWIVTGWTFLVANGTALTFLAIKCSECMHDLKKA
jgi:hypothetical protein